MGVIAIHLTEIAFEPGSELVGEVEVSALSTRQKQVAISLLWYTAGKGTEDVEIVEQVHLDIPLASGVTPRGRLPFNLRLPDFPWTFSGTLVSLIWAVEAGLEPDGEVDRVEIVVAPRGEEVRI